MTGNTPKRIKRYQAFKKYMENSQKIFEELKNGDDKTKKLAGYYSLCVCPGGSQGGTSDRTFEIFYGQRPFDTQRTDPFNSNGIKVLVEYGARLHYHLLDNGLVLTVLHPARTDNFSPTEKSIMLTRLIEPKKLVNISKGHFKLLNSYMQCTGLDGDPSILEKARVFYTRFTNHLIIDGKKQPTRVSAYVMDIIKFALTVGFSGFLLSAVTHYYSSAQDYTATIDDAHKKITSIDEQIKNIAKKLEAIKSSSIQITNSQSISLPSAHVSNSAASLKSSNSKHLASPSALNRVSNNK